MNELNISAVDATAMETATTTSAPKHKWLSKLTRGAKKATMFATVAGVMAMTCTTQAFAAGTGEVDTSSFITTACTVLKSVICLIGGGVSLWGVVNLLEGYGNDNPGANAHVRTAVELDARFGECCLRTAADASTNQSVHTVLH